MWNFPISYDVIVIGGGHAGCEAASATARMGLKTLLLTMNLDVIGKMSCNPAIGGVAKGQIVREIDALGGIMAKISDMTGIQYRMLNRSKGPSVWSPRAQIDKDAYRAEMKHHLELTPNLDIKQGTIEDLLVSSQKIEGVSTKEGIIYRAKTVILSSGTFLRGLLHIGEAKLSGGRAGDQPSVGLSASLEKLGLKLGRLKTGTPPRIHAGSIDYSLTEEQIGEEDVKFSFDELSRPRLPQVSCHITYTTNETKQIILDNLHRSPMHVGKITGVGPRYCPSIEDKIVRFGDKERHQIFLEPEGLQTQEVYVNGVSSALPFDVQEAFIHSVPALRYAKIMRPAYAIEYDYVESGQILPSLECKNIEGLFLAGQINGTSGYEEAAAQGLIAGINAAYKIKQKPPLILKRSVAYIGVMIDDLITKGLDEPYRMFTSRAEHRLLLRQDNADLRLGLYGYEAGLNSASRYQKIVNKQATIEKSQNHLHTHYKQLDGRGYSLAQLLCRPEYSYEQLVKLYPQDFIDYGAEINKQIELEIKYAGYIERQKAEINKSAHLEELQIPLTFNYSLVTGLRNEAKQKLAQFTPQTIGQAQRICGVSPADISILLVALTKQNRQKTSEMPSSFCGG